MSGGARLDDRPRDRRPHRKMVGRDPCERRPVRHERSHYAERLRPDAIQPEDGPSRGKAPYALRLAETRVERRQAAAARKPLVDVAEQNGEAVVPAERLEEPPDLCVAVATPKAEVRHDDTHDLRADAEPHIEGPAGLPSPDGQVDALDAEDRAPGEEAVAAVAVRVVERRAGDRFEAGGASELGELIDAR